MSDNMIPYEPSDLIVLEQGEICQATMTNVAIKYSKEAGHPMYRIMYRAKRSDGRVVNACDFITMPSCLGKLNDLARVIGGDAPAKFAAKTFTPSDYIGTTVLAFLQPAPGQFGTFNKVVRYMNVNKSVMADKPSATSWEDAVPQMNMNERVYDDQDAPEVQYDDLPF